MTFCLFVTVSLCLLLQIKTMHNFKTHNSKNIIHEEVAIMGPYGTPTRDIFDSTHALLIGCGIGVTPFASILQSISHRFKARRRGDTSPEVAMRLRKVDFIWVNREQRAFEWFVSLLSQLEAEESRGTWSERGQCEICLCRSVVRCF